MQQPPQWQPYVPPPTKAPKPSRGILLTLLLVSLTLGAIGTLGFSLFAVTVLKRMAHGDPDVAAQLGTLVKLTLVLAAVGFAQLACALGMWMWKRWGVYGFVGLSVLQFLLSSKADPQHHPSFSGLVWIALVLAAALPRWSAFED